MKYWLMLACLTRLTLECVGYLAFSLFGIWPDTGFLFAGYLAWPDTGYPAYSFFMSCLNYFLVISWINIRQNIRYPAKADIWPDILYLAKINAGYPAGQISGKSISCAPLLDMYI